MMAGSGAFNLNVLSQARGDYPTARRLLRDCLRVRREAEDGPGAACVFETWAALRQREGEAGEAVRFWSAAEKIRAVLGSPPTEVNERTRQRTLDALRAELGAGAFEAAWEFGRRWGVEQAAGRILGE